MRELFKAYLAFMFAGKAASGGPGIIRLTLRCTECNAVTRACR